MRRLSQAKYEVILLLLDSMDRIPSLHAAQVAMRVRTQMVRDMLDSRSLPQAVKSFLAAEVEPEGEN